jgi:hypothetical protein
LIRLPEWIQRKNAAIALWSRGSQHFVDGMMLSWSHVGFAVFRPPQTKKEYFPDARAGRDAFGAYTSGERYILLGSLDRPRSM